MIHAIGRAVASVPPCGQREAILEGIRALAEGVEDIDHFAESLRAEAGINPAFAIAADHAALTLDRLCSALIAGDQAPVPSCVPVFLR